MKITVVHQGALGDTVLLASLLTSLKRRWPAAVRTLVTRSSFGQLMVKLDLAEIAADADDTRHSAWFGQENTDMRVEGMADSMDVFPPSLPWADCELLLSAVSSGQDAWATHARRACAQSQILFFEQRPPPDYPHHVTAFHREQLQPLRLPPPLIVDLGRIPDGPLLIHPGSGGREKCWPLENFIRVAHEMNKGGIATEFLLGEAELLRFSREDIVRLDKEFVVHRNVPLVQVVDLLTTSRGYLGNDSGITHLAAWVGMPVGAIFGSSSARQWHPIGSRVRVFQSAMSQSGGDLPSSEVRNVAYMLGAAPQNC